MSTGVFCEKASVADKRAKQETCGSLCHTLQGMEGYSELVSYPVPGTHICNLGHSQGNGDGSPDEPHGLTANNCYSTAGGNDR